MYVTFSFFQNTIFPIERKLNQTFFMKKKSSVKDYIDLKSRVRIWAKIGHEKISVKPFSKVWAELIFSVKNLGRIEFQLVAKIK